MRAPLLATAALVLLGLTLSARPAHGGTLCGEVRDAATGAPVAHVGIFVRTPAGAYTGYYGASDEAGAFNTGVGGSGGLGGHQAVSGPQAPSGPNGPSGTVGMPAVPGLNNRAAASRTFVNR